MARECGASRCIKVSLRLLAILGHDDVRVTQDVSHNLRPCTLAQQMAGIGSARKTPKIPVIALADRGRIPAKSGGWHLRAQWNAGVYVRNLQPTRRSPRLQGLTEWRGSCPYPAR
jgi:hypothetical protein